MVPLYCIDTSALIHAWKRDYPRDVFPSVWERLESLAAEERLLWCEEVLLELKRGEDDLYDWVSRRQSFHPLTEAVQTAVTDIIARWPQFVPEDSHDGIWADPYVVALASVKGATVVTGENPAGPGARRPKIPNICAQLGVCWTNMLGLLREEKCNF